MSRVSEPQSPRFTPEERYLYLTWRLNVANCKMVVLDELPISPHNTRCRREIDAFVCEIQQELLALQSQVHGLNLNKEK